jgi:hypothetical protein
MATEQLDARALLAKMEAEERTAREKADKIAEDNAKKKKELLEKLRDEDLADVRQKCKMHGFTATELRGFLVTRGGKNKTPRKSTVRKTPARKRSSKSS